MEPKRNNPGEAVTPAAYRRFILNALEASGGHIEEQKLDELIQAAYSSIWGPTDLAPWGSQRHPKWKQNVASAKSALDRTGRAIRFRHLWYDGKRRRVTVYRVLIPSSTIVDAVLQWHGGRNRQSKKRRYKPLPQPRPVTAVPVVDV